MKGRHGGKRSGAGRPAGRKNAATLEQRGTIQEIARDYTDLAIRTLAEVAAKSENDSARVAAANHILDRGYGKATQAHRHAGPNGGPIPIVDLTRATDDQLDAIEAIFGPLAAAGGDDGGDPGGEGEASG
ncbi:hypothetical protein DK419_13285 [Methylobacterium terrae]|uniref:DUF5681 domain-containing protein n=1 Tax=Methylobacterium terrae TaxID=2202827 RepID=A0A2U8WM10_9HYPH|nr:hypothetical protein [Methylobacterium terrae]AWN47169.1 hypothetical protein DK419_13285 [Methylobacterium terrae]